jgi:TonB-linked SusC/RagA family outer membrane protein
MKKNEVTDFFRKGKSFQKLLMIMKLSTFLIFLAVFQLSAKITKGQEAKVTLDAKSLKVFDVLSEIEKQTNYLFFYSPKEINMDKHISLVAKNEKVSDILDEIFDGTEISYKMVNEHIVLTKRNRINPVANSITTTIAQGVRITGTVTDGSTNEPLAGVNVLVDGTTLGVITDIDGKFTIDVPNANSSLSFSFIGYVTEKISLANQSTVDVKLMPDIKSLEEIVVIGYGTQRKGTVTSSIASVKQADFVQGGVTDVGQLIQGKVAGLTISTVSGDPTSNSQIRLRGNTTLYGTSTNPLVIIDGVPGDLNTVAPEDIESIDALKDGSAAAIYGTIGSNGVIIITTKKASGSYKSTVEYSAYASTQEISKKLEMSTAADVRDQIAKGYRPESDDRKSSTDWLDEITRTPITHSHNITIRGGNDKTNYLASANYKAAQGIMLKSDNNLLNIRADLNHMMFDNKVKININALSRYDKYTTTADGVSFDGYTYRQAIIYNPTAPVMENGKWYEEVGAFNYDNPVSRIKESDGRNSSQFSRFNASISYEPIKGLVFKSLASYSKYNETRGYAQTKQHISTLRYGLNGFASTGSTESVDRLLELTAEYNKTLNKHNFTILGGYSYRDNNRLESWMRNVNFPTDVFGYSNIQLGSGLKEGDPNTAVFSGRYITNLIGFFGRLSYNFGDKYLIMASLRREAASQLVGTKDPWGSFPSVSIGWKISNEPFMQNLNFIDDLKIRGGYGVTGSQPSASFLGMATMGYSGYFYADGQWKNSLGPTQNPNPYLRWEEKKETNIGFDFALFKNRVSGTVDYYNRRIDGLLYDYTVPMPPNQVATTRANVGKMDNRGVEVLINVVPVQKKDFEWTSSFNFSTNKNELVSLSNELYKSTTNYINDGNTGEPIQTYTHRLKVGGSVGDFYGFKVVDISEQGRWIYQDKAGNQVESEKFARVDSNKMVLGNGLPKFYAGWNNTFRYKNFDLSITMRGAFDFQILNFERMYLENTKTTQYNRLRSAYDKVFGKAVLSKAEDLEYNSYYIEDGDYWKIDNITLGYNFKLKNIKYIQSARVYVSTLNTFTFTGYKGLDPEVQTDGLEPGNDYRDKYPTARTYTIGLNVKF